MSVDAKLAYFKNQWTPGSCSSDPSVVKHFKDVVEYFDALPSSTMGSMVWTEWKDGDVVTCETDAYHCGNGYRQFVLGRFNTTSKFVNCANYQVLNISDWSLVKNDLFIYDITRPEQKNNMHLPVCSIFPIRVYFNDAGIPEDTLVDDRYKDTGVQLPGGAVTSRELCILISLGYSAYMVKKDGQEYEDYILMSQYSMSEIVALYRKSGRGIYAERLEMLW